MSEQASKAPFLDRFEQARSAILGGEIRHGACWTLCVVACGIGLLATADYLFELPWVSRAIGLALVGCAAAGVAVKLIAVPIFWWSRPRTAAEIERRFPQLGQRVRTVVQYSGRPESAVASEGVAPTLLGALEEDTESQARPLDLAAAYPWWKLNVGAAAAAAPVLLLLLLALIDWEARLAILRALLAGGAYTELAVSPGDVLVDQGADVAVSVELRGRTDRCVVVCWRAAGQLGAPWHEMELASEDARAGDDGALRYEASLEDIDRATEYRAVAGPMESEVYRVSVRYPLVMKKLEVELTPPAYTQLEPQVVQGGDLDAIEGSTAAFRIELDGPCSEASLILRESPAGAPIEQQPPEPKSIPMTLDGRKLLAQLELRRDASYSVVARSADGRQLPENEYRIRVRTDQPPNIRFEEPNEALEVHPLAEVLMRIRVADDFGLSGAGIVFQLDNREEQTLLLQEFTTGQRPEKEKGRPAPTVRAVAEDVLALEDLKLTPTQSVTYYAFAQDNHPDGPRRTETDLRFIDIRPFKRIYRLGGACNCDGRGRCLSLEELIARQRFNLNRTTRLQRTAARSEPLDPAAVQRVIEFEEKLAELTRSLGEGYQQFGLDAYALLFEAEALMSASVDALFHGDFDKAVNTQKDALVLLVKARDRVLQLLKQCSPQQALAFQSYSRTQLQKIRMPEDSREQERKLASQLRKLADDEEFVYATLCGIQRAQAERDLEELQRGIADEAQALEQMIQRNDALTDLAKARMGQATAKAEQASDALARDRSKEAAQAAKAAESMFRELAQHVEGLEAQESAGRIAAARDLAGRMARRERELADALPTERPGDQAGVTQRPGAQAGVGRDRPADHAGLAERAAGLAESGRTLEDLLAALAQTDEEHDTEAAQEARQLLREGELAEALLQMQEIEGLLQSGNLRRAGVEILEIARYLDGLSLRLDTLYRRIVTPQIEELLALEERASTLRDRLPTLRSQLEIHQWHDAAEALTRDLAEYPAAQVEAVRLLEVMREAGWGDPLRHGWDGLALGSDYGPGGYLEVLDAIVERLQQHVRELLLRDLVASEDEPIPPEYEELVDRYFKVLSEEVRSR